MDGENNMGFFMNEWKPAKAGSNGRCLVFMITMLKHDANLISVSMNYNSIFDKHFYKNSTTIYCGEIKSATKLFQSALAGFPLTNNKNLD